MTEHEQQGQLLVLEDSWWQRWQRLMQGLKAPKDSGEYKYSVYTLQRYFGSTSASTAVTVGLVLVLLFCFSGAGEVLVPNLEVTYVEPKVEKLEKIEEEKIEEPQPTEVVEFDPSSEMANSDVESIAVEAPSFGDGSTDTLAPQAVDIIRSSMVIKGLYGARTGGGRAAAVGKHGGGGSLTAVLRALRWLKAHQNADGSWSPPCPTAMTGLALLCYMAHGETPASEEFGPTVEKAIKYLLSIQNSNGLFPGTRQAYSHAIATYGMAESYGMTKMLMLKEPLERAVGVIIKSQQGAGNWGEYNYSSSSTRKDMSIFSWQIQALKAADLAGAQNEGLQDALYKAVTGLKLHAAPEGGFDYGGPGKSETLTGAGILCLELLGHLQDDAAQKSLQASSEWLPDWPKTGGGTYGWYYMTQARFQNGGPLWDKWNKAMLPMMIKNQKDDGHWENGSTHEASPVYDTALCCLCLEVYYRYLPTYARANEVQRAPKNKQEQDVKIAVGEAL